MESGWAMEGQEENKACTRKRGWKEQVIRIIWLKQTGTITLSCLSGTRIGVDLIKFSARERWNSVDENANNQQRMMHLVQIMINA